MARAPPVPSPLEPNPGDTTCKRRRYQRTQRTFLTQIRPTLRVTRREKPAHYTHAPSHCKHLHCTGTRHMKTTTAHTRQPHTTRSSQISRRTRRAAHNEQHTAAHNPQSSTFLGTQPKASDGSRTRPEATPCRFSTRIKSTHQFHQYSRVSPVLTATNSIISRKTSQQQYIWPQTNGAER